MENSGSRSISESPVARRSVERALEPRYARYRDEVSRLIEAGRAVMRRTGSLDPRVGEVVGEAGLSNQAFYRHFRSKQEFLLAVLDAGTRELLAYLRHQMAAAAGPEPQIRAWVEGVLAQALDPTAAAATRPFVLPRARLAERFPDEVRASLVELTAPLREAIAAAVASGALPGADPDGDSDLIYDLAMGWVQRKLAESATPSEGEAARVADFALCGLRRG